MDDNKSGFGWVGILLVVVVMWILFGAFNNNGGLFGNHGGYAAQPYMPYGPCGCNRVSNCEVEKQGIIDSARTQFLIEKTSYDNREAIMGQASRIYEQGLQETIFDQKLKIMSLENEANANARFNALSKQYSDCCCELNRRLDGIECRMLTKPQLSGIGVTCSGQLVPPLVTG